MRVFFIFFLGGLAVLAFFAGSGELQRWSKQRANIDSQVIDHKRFVVILYTHNGANFCERMLRSVFEQNYNDYRVLFVDDGSVDGSFERVQQFCMDQEKQERVILMKNEDFLGPFRSLVRAIDQCMDQEIIIPLEGWFAHREVLANLNRAFQDREIWLSLARKIEYPTYQLVGPEEKKGAFPGYSFYAGMFRALLHDHHTDFSFLLKLGKGHLVKIEDPLFFTNLAFVQKENPPD